MEQARAWFDKQNDLQKKILLAALILIGLMILFPPKYTFRRDPIFLQTTSESAGYQFILTDPSAEQKKAARIIFGDEVDKFIGSGIEWSKLFVQFLVVGGAAGLLLVYTKRNPMN